MEGADKQKQQTHVAVLLSRILALSREHFYGYAQSSGKQISAQAVANNDHNKTVLKIWDGTLGMGGHSAALLEQFANAFLFASDHDADMLQFAERNLKAKFASRLHLQRANYAQNPFADSAPFDLILLDLGISSLHYDFFERGFSFRYEQKLDMRMDSSLNLSAADWLAVAKEEEIRRVLFEYGEEKRAACIAQKICRLREEAPIETSTQLKEICQSCYPHGFAYSGRSHADRNPAVRTFQAVRIFINHELESLKNALRFLPDLLSPQGILFIIAFHSLEDKLVKKTFLERSRKRDVSPQARSYYQKGEFAVLQNKAIMASEQEIQENPRARSARLRVLKKLPTNTINEY